MNGFGSVLLDGGTGRKNHLKTCLELLGIRNCSVLSAVREGCDGSCEASSERLSALEDACLSSTDILSLLGPYYFQEARKWLHDLEKEKEYTQTKGRRLRRS